MSETKENCIQLLSLAQLTTLGPWQMELLHENSYDLLIWVTKGQGLAILDGSRRGVGTHNALFIPAGKPMSLDLGRQGYAQALIFPSGTDLTLPKMVLHLRIRDVGAQNELTAIFEHIGREQNSNRQLCQNAIRAYADLAAIWLRRHWDVEPKGATAAQRLMRAFFDRLGRNFNTGEPMANFASALGVTPTHLTRVCKAQTGKTASELLSERVLHRARQLLTETDAPIQDIARELGFGSPAYFTRFITQHCGHAPSKLRQISRR